MLSVTFKIVGTLVGACLWFLVFKIVDHLVRIETTPKKLIDLKNRIVAVIHAVVAVILCSYAILTKD